MTQLSGWLALACLIPVATSSSQVPPSSLKSCTRGTVIATVISTAGPVLNLDSNHFLATSKAQALKVVTVKPRRHPPRAIVLIDLSGSMSRPGKLKIVSSIAHGFVDAAPEQASLALVTFTNQIQDRFDFLTSRSTILQKIDAIGRQPETSGGTAIFDVLKEATELFGAPQDGDVLFLISDGGKTNDHMRLSGLKELLLQRGIRLYSVVPFEEPLREANVDVGLYPLEDVARDTGGKAVTVQGLTRSGWWDSSPRRLDENNELGKYVYMLTCSGYDLEIEIEKAVQKPLPLTLKIVGSDGKVLRNVQSLYPHELFPCIPRTH